MTQLSEYLGELPNVSGSETVVDEAMARHGSIASGAGLYAPAGGVDIGRIRSSFGIALHMHQPLIPAGGEQLETAGLISNLQYMFEHQDIGDNHNAGTFHWCYKRIGEFLRQLQDEGKQPRAMLEYSGTLFHGLRKIGLHDVFDALKSVTCDPGRWHTVEWLGMPWGHPVAPSTPVQDYALHVKAWQHHFAAIFGSDALARVRGYSPSEMALPNHPDVAYTFVKTLKDAGYEWVILQEHTVEEVETGWTPRHKHIPHRLVIKNSNGDEVSMACLIKTQGSDTKLVAHMQPYYEAQSLSRVTLPTKSGEAKGDIPPFVIQISDGENGGVMMNEFPGKFFEAMHAASYSDAPAMNGTEYLEHLYAAGFTEKDFPEVQPLFHKRIWERITPGDGPKKLEKAIEDLKQEDGRFHMDGGSWTNDISWVQGYENVLGPMEQASSAFNEVVLKSGVGRDDARFRNALFHLMSAQTSCYRYWGQGLWTDYGRELCRRTQAIIQHDF